MSNHLECYAASLYMASKRKNPKNITVTPKQVNSKFGETGHTCSYTGIVTETKRGGTWRAGTASGANPFKVTIDRVNAEKGYSINNIKPTCWFVNQMKGILSEKVFKAAVFIIAYPMFKPLIAKGMRDEAKELRALAIKTVRTGK